MADAKALGGALSYNPLIAPSVQAKLLEAQQQQAIASALLGEGMSPLDIKDRQIGGVGYAISPLEGLGKLAQALSGRYQLSQANKDYMSAFQPKNSADGSTVAGVQDGGILSSQGASILQGVPANLQPLVASWATTEPRAAAELIAKFAAPTEQQKNFGGQGTPAFQQWVQNQTNPGSVKYQEALGANAAGNAPAGMMPPGLQPPQDNGQLPPVPSQVPQVQGMQPSNSQLTNAATQGMPPMPAQALNPNQAMGAQVNPMAVPPAFNNTGMPSPMPNESQNQYMARLDAAKAGATSRATAEGTGMGDANVNLAQINSRIENAKKNVQEMLGIADNTSTAVPLVPEDLQHKYIQRFDPKTATANTRFEQLNNQIYVQELGPLIKQLGSRGNMFVERAVKAGSAIDIGDNPAAKKVALQGILEYLDNIQKNAANQQGILAGTQPNQPSPASQGTNGWSITRVR